MRSCFYPIFEVAGFITAGGIGTDEPACVAVVILPSFLRRARLMPRPRLSTSSAPGSKRYAAPQSTVRGCEQWSLQSLRAFSSADPLVPQPLASRQVGHSV